MLQQWLVLVLLCVVCVVAVENGDLIYLFECNASNPAMLWELDLGTSTVINQAGSKCMEVQGSNTADGAVVQMWDCDGGSNQQITLDTTQEWAPLSVVFDGKCVDIANTDSEPGAIVHQWTYYAYDNQLWHLNDDNTITSKLSGLCLQAGKTPIPTCTDPSISGYPYCDASLSPSDRVSDLLPRLTLDEKLAMVHGYGGLYAGTVYGNAQWGIPELTLEDGPQGVADGVTEVTCFPSALTVVASWNRSAMRAFGEAMAVEQKAKGTNIILGPMENIARVPVGGRNFESTGEDPYVSGAYVTEVIKGIQGQGLIGCAKHYIDNNQEYDRTTVSAIVDDRTQHEIYLPHFKAAVEAGVGSFMCSYNLINGTWACENDYTLNHLLKEELGFQGFVMSDWGATHSTVLAANSGLDMQMPDDGYFGSALATAVQDGDVPESRIDDMATRILLPMFAVGLFDRPAEGSITANVTSEDHDLLARQLAIESTVLLKNDGTTPLLPFSYDTVNTIAVIGAAAHSDPIVAGGGSGYVIPAYIVTALDGITARAGSNIVVSYNDGSDVDAAAKVAANSDVAVVVVACTSSEGSDRSTLALGGNQDDLVTAVVSAQPNTVVAVNSPGAVLMPWVDKVPSIVESFMPGQEWGNALASILFGDANPSGKLPLSFPASDDQTWLKSANQYPGINDVEYYTEGLFLGYRYYDENQIVPLFSFGHGLSYTTFGYTSLTASSTVVTAVISNTGSFAGAEVPQLYIGFPDGFGEPPKVLRGYTKVFLTPGDKTTVTFNLDRTNDLSIWDVDKQEWTSPSGTYTVMVGSASDDIRLTGAFTL